MAVSQEKISVHSLSDLKNTSDDAIPAYLNSLKFTQSHTLTDIRLGLGYTAFAICAACFYWDYSLGFEPTKHWTAAAVVIYAIIQSFLTYWLLYVESGKVYIGTSTKGERIEVSTKVQKKLGPVYEITVRSWGADGRERKSVTVKRQFMKWFDKEGHFVARPFQQLFASNFEVVGMVDQKNIVRGKEEGSVKVQIAPSTASMEDKWASLLNESQPGVTGVEVEEKVPSKRGKGKKKA